VPSRSPASGQHVAPSGEAGRRPGSDHLGGASDRIDWEQDRVEDAGASAVAQGGQVHRAVQAEETTETREREAEPELDRGELGTDDDQEGEAAGPAGQPGVEQPDGLDRDLGEMQLQDAGVPGRRVELYEPAAATRLAPISGRGRWRVEAHGQVERVALPSLQRRRCRPMPSQENATGPSAPLSATPTVSSASGGLAGPAAGADREVELVYAERPDRGGLERPSRRWRRMTGRPRLDQATWTGKVSRPPGHP
jgi:hypothetical protein